MPIAEKLTARDVILDFPTDGKRDLLQALAAAVAPEAGLPEIEILDALTARERLGSTALGRGVALPHARLSGMDRPVMRFLRLRRPIGYEARDEEPVDLVILVLWPEAEAEGFLPTLSEVCRSLRDPQVLRRLRASATPEEVATLLRAGEA
ncbi:PTS sugar transporter subunit IIA [Sabulicella glaciei]|uniref:PTS sugar transporter subunit IIA n=1 Tax=Sabulicella glaciei TaxID=2984948 RepID=A0ABT3NQI9_9PROT|nr:PTS sugar transporter subunit IIA [Roseococcus sp. MDT2-1-1]MCW8084424.1 PTS sugar transporter subunit IIA [Roseococcus sp. MDT2-1-1]